jgi:O-antigen/teichoic acid export membrane protein
MSLLTWYELKDVMSFAWKAQATGVASLINTQVDSLLIALLLPIQIVGLYGIGANFAGQLKAVAGNALVPIRNQLASTFGRLGPAKALSRFREMQETWVVGITGWTCAGLGATYFGITAWLGPKFTLSAVICVILMSANAINLYTGMTTIYLNVIGRPGIEAIYAGVSVIVNVVLTCAFAVFGAVGIVGATAIGIVVGSCYLIRLLHQRVSTEIPGFFKDVPIISGVVAALASFIVDWIVHSHLPPGALGLLFSGLVAVPGFLLYFVLFFGRSISIDVLRSCWRKIVPKHA